jgi:hypothetical protein
MTPVQRGTPLNALNSPAARFAQSRGPRQPKRWLRFRGRMPALSVPAGGQYLPNVAGLANGLVGYQGDILGTPNTGRRWWVTYGTCATGVNQPNQLVSFSYDLIPSADYPAYNNIWKIAVWPQQDFNLAFTLASVEDFGTNANMPLDFPVYLIEGEYLATFMHVRNDSAAAVTMSPQYLIQVLEEDLDADNEYVGS